MTTQREKRRWRIKKKKMEESKESEGIKEAGKWRKREGEVRMNVRGEDTWGERRWRKKGEGKYGAWKEMEGGVSGGPQDHHRHCRVLCSSPLPATQPFPSQMSIYCWIIAKCTKAWTRHCVFVTMFLSHFYFLLLSLFLAFLPLPPPSHTLLRSPFPPRLSSPSLPPFPRLGPPRCNKGEGLRDLQSTRWQHEIPIWSDWNGNKAMDVL